MPNILITGTPGTGKSTLSEAVKEQTNLNHIDVAKLIKEKSLHDGWDEKYQCYILNEDKVCDELEDLMASRNNIVDFHTCDFFPERWFDLVVVLRTDNTILYPRLEKRGYPQFKITENISAEILQVVLDEARESYKPEIVWELASNTVEDMENNVERIVSWVNEWRLVHESLDVSHNHNHKDTNSNGNHFDSDD
jgi:adenylate kinase